MKVYYGKRGADGFPECVKVIQVDPRHRNPEQYINHLIDQCAGVDLCSIDYPDKGLCSFNWGYNGNGSHTLALSILYDFYNCEGARKVVNEFVDQFVSRFKDNWFLMETDIP